MSELVEPVTEFHTLEIRYRIFRLPYSYEDEYAPWVAQRIGAEINLLSSRRFDSQTEAMEWVSHLLNLLT